MTNCVALFLMSVILRPLAKLVMLKVDIMLSVIKSYIYGRS